MADAAKLPEIERALNERGPKDRVLAAVAASRLPDSARAFLAARIAAADGEGVSLFYQEHPHGADDLGQWHIKKLY